jgi:putative hydrolase of HD superfamily
MDGILDFLSTCENLKRTKRTGWIEHGINMPESISDHMHRMGIISMLSEDANLDRNKFVLF